MVEQKYPGLFAGALAVMAFGLTLPVTHFASSGLNPLMIGIGRAAVAGVMAAFLLWLRRATCPAQDMWRQLLFVMGGVVIGFPLLSVWAMQRVPAVHGGIIMGILPLFTALLGSWFSRERPSIVFWWASFLGAVIVLLYLLSGSLFQLHLGDVFLLMAAVAAAIGYAKGGLLSLQMPAWQVICWALVLALPVTLPVFLWQLPDAWRQAQAVHWLAFLYLAWVSQLLGFFLWYAGLAWGGVIRVSQVQLLQPFVTLGAAGFLLDEALPGKTLVFAILMMVIVAATQKLPVYWEHK